MISITITDLGALPQSERERLADYLRGPVQSKPAEVTTVPHVAAVDLGEGRGFAVTAPAPALEAGDYTEVVIDTAAVFASPAAKPEKDAQGVVWDARIHASTRNMNKDGTWKRLRGCDDVLFAQVMGELTGVTAQRPAPVIEPTPTPVTPPPPAPPAATDAITTFPQLMTAITSKGIPAPTVITTVREVGESVGWENATLPMLGTGRAELIPEVARRLGLV